MFKITVQSVLSVCGNIPSFLHVNDLLRIYSPLLGIKSLNPGGGGGGVLFGLNGHLIYLLMSAHRGHCFNLKHWQKQPASCEEEIK